MKLYSVHLPPLRLTFNHPKQQQWLQDEYNDVGAGCLLCCVFGQHACVTSQFHACFLFFWEA